MILTINGDIGSGKSTVGKALAHTLGIPYYSTGNILRTLATERNLTILELMNLAKTDPSIDREIDTFQKNLPKTVSDFVIEGRLGWYFIPQAVKLFLRVDPDEAARRIFLAQQQAERDSEHIYTSIEEVKVSMKKRADGDLERYQTLYGVDPTDLRHYDFVIDTTHKTPQAIVQEILDKIDT